MGLLSLISMLVGFLLLALGSLIFYLEPRSTKNRIYLLLCLAGGFWAFTEFGAANDTPQSDVMLWLKLSTFSLVAFALFFHFSLVFTEKRELLNRKLVYFAIYFPAVFLTFLDVTYNLLSRYSVRLPLSDWLTTDTSPIYRLNVAAALILGIVGFYEFWKYYRQVQNSDQKRQIKYIMLGFSFAIIVGVGVESVSHLFSYHPPEITTLAFAAGMVAVGYSLWKEKMSRFTPAGVAEDIVAHISDFLFLVSPEGRILFANQVADEHLGYREGELKNQSLTALFSPQDVSEIYKEGEAFRVWDTEISGKNGEKIPVSLSISRIWAGPRVRGVVAIGRDLTYRRQIEEKLLSRLKTEKFLNKVVVLSTQTVSLGEMMEGILKLLGESMDLARAAIYQYDRDDDTFSNNYEWTKGYYNSRREASQKLAAADFPFLREKILKKELLLYKEIEELPKGKEKEFLKNLDYNSALMLPVFIGDELYGFISLGKSREKIKWPPEDIEMVNSLLWVLSGLIKQKRVEEQLRKENERLKSGGK